jgi:hypothetical protein
VKEVNRTPVKEVNRMNALFQPRWIAAAVILIVILAAVVLIVASGGGSGGGAY